MIDFKSNAAAVKSEMIKRVKQHLQETGIPFNCPNCKQEITLSDGLNSCPHCKANIEFERLIEDLK